MREVAVKQDKTLVVNKDRLFRGITFVDRVIMSGIEI